MDKTDEKKQNNSKNMNDNFEFTKPYLPDRLSLLEKHGLTEIVQKKKKVMNNKNDIQSNTNIISEVSEKISDISRHSSVKEKKRVTYVADAPSNEMAMTKTHGSKSLDSAQLARKNVLEDAAVPRIHTEPKPAIVDEIAQLPVESTPTDCKIVTEKSLIKRSLSLSDLQAIEAAQKEALKTTEDIPKCDPDTKKSEDEQTEQINKKKMSNKSSRYVVIRTIGKGNFAKVKLAKHLATDKIVAIKMIDKTKLEKKELSKISREVSLMKQLKHPNIVQLLEVMENETTLYLVMEYASGGELFDNLVVHGKMNEKEARIKFREMISAIQYCHSKSIVHRDLKAENMLLNERLEIKIADFGFANKFDPNSMLGTFCGSPPYAAPELYQGKKYIGPEVDIWALGVILFSLVSGRLPFDGESFTDLKKKVVHLRYEFPYYVSNDCENLLKKILVHANERATLDTIINDPWVNGGGLPKLTPHQDEDFQICPQRYELLKEMGFPEADIDETFLLKKFNTIHATYILLKPKPTKAVAPYQRGGSSSTNDSFNRTTGKKHIELPVPIDPQVVEGKKEGHSLTNSNALSFAKALKNLFFKKNDSPNKDSKDSFTAGVSKDLQKQYQNAMSHIPHELLMDPNSSIPKGTNQQALFATINQLSITKHHKAGMFQQTTIGPLSAKQIMENNQLSAPPIFHKNSKVSIKGQTEATVNMGKFTVQNIKANQQSQAPTVISDPETVDSTARKSQETKGKSKDVDSNTKDLKSKKKPESRKDNVSGASSKISNATWAKFDSKIKPQIANFAFSMYTVSSKHADDIMLEIIRILEENRFSYDFLEKYLLLCNLNPKQIETYGDAIQWEMEVCRIPLLFMNGVRMKRIFGSTFAYKNVASKISRSLKL